MLAFVAVPVSAQAAPPSPAPQASAKPSAPAQTSPPAATPVPAPAGTASAPPSPAATASAEPPLEPGVPAPTAAPLPFSVWSDRLTYYSNRDLVTGEDHVRIQLPGDVVLTGAYFAMDLKLNRFVVAGGVELTYPGGHLSGAAFARYLDFNRSYFVPVTDQPDRWTFIGTDFAHPLKGRDMPGDTFYLPDAGHQHIFLTAKSGRFIPKNSVFFHDVRLSQLGTFVPIPTYFLSFSRNPNFGQNSLAGATVDDPFPFTGSSNAISTMHVRYGDPSQVYLSYEQHLVTDKSYVVASINPLTQPQKQYNLTASDIFGTSFQLTTFLQESAFQHWLNAPLSASGYGYASATAGLRQSYLQARTDWYYQSLLAQPAPGVAGLLYYGDPSHPWLPDHPSDGQLTWNGFDHRVSRHVPLEYRLRSGYGFAHDPYEAISYLNNDFVNNVWFSFVGADLYTPSVKIGRYGAFNALFDKQRMWFSLPHHIDTTTTTFSLSRLFGPKAAAYIAYQIQNTGDFYGAQQSIAYPPGSAGAVDPNSGQFVPNPYPDYAAFRGFTTLRGLVEGISFTPNPYFQTSFTMHENHDWPAPIAPSPLYNLAGRPPLEIDGDVRFRINRSTAVDISRSYFFNFGDLRWSPQFTIRVIPP